MDILSLLLKAHGVTCVRVVAVWHQSIRDVKISTGLAADLAKWKTENVKNPYVSTFDGKRVQLMFASQVNGPCNRRNLKKAMDRAVQNAHENGTKLKRHDFYSLRHFCASFLIQEGLRRGLISDLEIARRMGHKDSTITRKVYARFLNSESTFNPNDLWNKPVTIEQAKQLAEIEPASELLN